MANGRFINLKKLNITPEQWELLKKAPYIKIIYEDNNVKDYIICIPNKSN